MKKGFTRLEFTYDNDGGSSFPLPLSEYAKKFIVYCLNEYKFKKLVIKRIKEKY